MISSGGSSKEVQQKEVISLDTFLENTEGYGRSSIVHRLRVGGASVLLNEVLGFSPLGSVFEEGV